jgi:hypothetical protein
MTEATPSIATTLEFGRETHAPAATSGSELEKGRVRNQELAAAQKAAETPKSIVKRGSTERHIEPFLTGQGEIAKTMFGAGSVEKNADETIKPPPESTEERILYDEGVRQLDRYGHQLAYTHALAEMRARGISKTDTLDASVMADLQKRGIKITETDYKTWRSETIADVRSRISPEAYADIPEADREQWIEDTVTSHDQYRTTVMSRMQAEYEKLKTLPQRETDSDYEAAKTTRTETIEQRDRSITEALGTLERVIPEDIPDDVKDRITTLVKEGKSTEIVISYLRTSILTPERIPHLNEFRQYAQDLQGSQVLKDKLLHNIRLGPEINQPDIDDLARIQARIDAVNTLLVDPAVRTQFESFQKIIILTSTAKDEGFYVGPLAQELNDSVNSQKEFGKADITVKAKEAAMTAKEQGWRAERLQAESESLTRIDGITEDAIDAVFEAQIGTRDRALKVYEAKAIEDAEKAGDTRYAAAIKKLRQEQDNHGVCRDEKTRKTMVNYEQLGKDVRFAAYHGEDATQRFILRDLMAGGTTGEKIMIEDPRTHANRPFDWRKDDISLLSETDTKYLQKLVAGQGDKYMQRLLGDFYIARGMGGRNGIVGQDNPFANARHLKLKDHEYASLAEHFGPALEAKANSSEDMKKAVEEARRKGAKGKGLLLIILGLLIGTAISAKDLASFK